MGMRSLQQSLYNLLRKCNNSFRSGTQIHAQILAHGLTEKSYIVCQLLAVYVGAKYVDHALRVFRGLRKANVTAWNQILRAYGGNGSPRKAVEVFKKLLESSEEADGYSFVYVVNACGRGGLVREGEELHGRVVRSGFGCNVYVKTGLVGFYGLCGDVGRARLVFEEMTERGVVTWNAMIAGYVRGVDWEGARRVFGEMGERNVVTWTTMIVGCVRSGRAREAVGLFGEMRRAGVEADEVALVAVLSACGEIGDLRLGRWVHWYVEARLGGKEEARLVSLDNALIHMYASCGLVEEGYKVFKQMPRRSTVSWTSIIVGFAKQGRGEEALRMFRSMLSSGDDGIVPDEVTFLCVLCGCSHAGLVDEGREIFKLMTQAWGLVPNIEHYGCMVDLLSRAGFLTEAHELVETMPMEPNAEVLGALLGGCMLHKNADLASLVAQKLTDALKPDQAAGYLVLLSNVYARANRWLDFAYVRQKMVQMGLKKPPGRSWIQSDRAVHDFVAGDRTHKHESLIHEMLSKITKQTQQEGFEADILNTVSLEE